MATIEAHTFFSSPNLVNPSDRLAPANNVAAYLDAGDARTLQLIRALPKKKDNDEHYLTVGLRHTLVALVECQRASGTPYNHEKGIKTSPAALSAFNCYTERTTKGHLKALAKAGWIGIVSNSPASEPSYSYKISLAIEHYAELTRLKLAAEDPSCLKNEHLSVALMLQLKLNQHDYESRQLAKKRSQLFARGGLGAQIIELAFKMAERDRAGLGIAYELREQIGICLPFLPQRPSGTAENKPNSEFAAQPKAHAEPQPSEPPPPGPLPATGSAAGEAALADKTPLCPTDISAQPTDAQRVTKLRHELLSLACHIDRKRLVPEVLAFARSAPSLAELEKKVEALKSLRGVAQETPTRTKSSSSRGLDESIKH